MIKVALIAATFTGPAQAGAWEEFEQRCLVPMENVELVQPHDLTASANFKNDGDTYSKYAFASGGYVLSISDGRAGQSQWCTVELESGGNEPASQIANKFLAWSSRPATAKQYEELPSESGVLTFRSRVWREPKMDVIMSPPATGSRIFLRAEETGLES